MTLHMRCKYVTTRPPRWLLLFLLYINIINFTLIANLAELKCQTINFAVYLLANIYIYIHSFFHKAKSINALLIITVDNGFLL